MTPQAHMLTGWYPAESAILGSAGNFSDWGVAGGSRSLGHVLVPHPFLSLFLLPVCHEVSGFSSWTCHHDTLPRHRPKAKEPADHGLKP
jgi:hypothetical protein